MERNFEIIIGSPINYNELVAYIWINGEEVALVQKEDGIDEMKVELFEERIGVVIPLDTFIEALNEARNELTK